MANPTFVQQATVAQANSVTTASGSIVGVTGGNTIIIGVQGFQTNANIPFVVKDDLNNQYSPVTFQQQIVNGINPYVFVLYNCPAGTRTITFTWGGATINFNGAVILEYSSAVGIGVSATPFSAASGTSATGNSLTTWGTNQLVMGFVTFHSGTATNAITPGSGYTARSTITQNTGGYSMVMEEQLQATAGTYSASASSTSAVSGSWVILTFTLIGAAPGTLTNGTVVLGTAGGSGSIIGTAGGNGGTTNAVVFDAYTGAANPNWTFWQNANASGDYVGIDCGAVVQASQVLISFNIGQYNAFVTPATAQLQASNDPAFGTFLTFFTFSNASYGQSSVVTGLFQNQFIFPQAGYYRYYRLTLPAANAGPADLEFYGNYYSGVSATCAPVSITNFNGTTGGNYDVPVRVRMSTTTTGAVIWYTLDGTTPSAGGGTSKQYTGPIIISANTVIQAIAVLSPLSNSRVTLASYHINSLVPTDIVYEVNRSGYRIWSIAGDKFQDPVSGSWFWYGMNDDLMGVYEFPTTGVDIYSSPDLRNWSYVGALSAVTNPQQNRVSVVYNQANNNYVMWLQQALSSNMSVFTASNPAGPWTQSGSTITSMDNYSTKGDHKLFLDSNGNCYLIFDTNGGPLPDNNSYTTIHLLNAAYTASSGTFVAYNNNTSGNTTPFGQQSEGFAMVKIGSTYYWQASNLSPWTPGLNLYVTNTAGPLGTWSAPTNAFQPDTHELTDGAAGFWGPGPLTPSQNYAYDSQTDGFYIIPGRQGINAGTPAVMYVGDRWDFQAFGVVQTPTDSFHNWRHIIQPVAVNPSTGALTIQWTNNWTFDSVFAQNTGKPAAATNVVVTTGATYTITWTNNEPKAYALYLDRSTNQYFTANVVSEVLASGTTSFVDSTVVGGTTYFYRVRTVNASGSSNTPLTPSPPYPVSTGASLLMTYFPPF